MAIVAAVLLAWHLYGGRSAYTELLVSTPLQAWDQLLSWLGDANWWGDVRITLTEATLGYLLGVAVAMVMVGVTASIPLMLQFLAPFISALNALPKIALAPIFILWFGTGMTSKTLFVASLVMFLMFYATVFALKMLDQSLISNLRILGASRIDLLLHVLAPSMVKQVISSLRTSSAWALLGAVIAEYLASNQGLGFLIAQGQRTFQTDVVIVGVLVVAMLAVCIDRLLYFIERRFSRWSSTD